MLEDWAWVDVEIDAERLTVEQRQIVEIARALLQGTRFIILDEPTAQLEAAEVARLFERIVRLQEGGVTFLYISHHLEEIYEVCRSVTVLRDGQVVANAPLATMPKERVVAAMVGDAVRAVGGPNRRSRPPAAGRLPASRCAGSRLRGRSGGPGFEVGRRDRGAGRAPGSGRADRPKRPWASDAVRGEIRSSAPLRLRLVIDACRKGVGYVPRSPPAPCRPSCRSPRT